MARWVSGCRADHFEQPAGDETVEHFLSGFTSATNGVCKFLRVDALSQFQGFAVLHGKGLPFLCADEGSDAGDSAQAP